MSKGLYIGLDVHAQTVAIAIAEPGGEVRNYGTVSGCVGTLEKTMSKLRRAHPGCELRVCYEAGPTGFDSLCSPFGLASAVCLTPFGCDCAPVCTTRHPLHGGRAVPDSESIGRSREDRSARRDQTLGRDAHGENRRLRVLGQRQRLRGAVEDQRAQRVAERRIGLLEHLPALAKLLDERFAHADRLGTLTLLDVRAPERYRGDVEPVDPVAGHIPGARNAPAAGNTGPDGRFLAPDVLRARYAALGADNGPVVVACGSGVNATQAALAMRIAGLPDPLLYPGSYSDWSTAGLPVATGDEPG